MSSKDNSDQLRSELGSLADTLEELLHSSADRSQEEFDKLKSKAEEVLKGTRESLGQNSRHLVDQTKQAADCANNYVHKNPWTSVGIGTAVGVVLGVLLARR